MSLRGWGRMHPCRSSSRMLLSVAVCHLLGCISPCFKFCPSSSTPRRLDASAIPLRRCMHLCWMFLRSSIRRRSASEVLAFRGRLRAWMSSAAAWRLHRNFNALKIRAKRLAPAVETRNSPPERHVGGSPGQVALTVRGFALGPPRGSHAFTSPEIPTVP